MSTIFGAIVFGGFIVGIWIAFRLFMRGDTYAERVAGLLPKDFRPDLFHRKGDTYVGYEQATDRLALVDWPHGTVLAPRQVQSLELVQESMLGVRHHWIAFTVPDSKFPQYRIWFQFRRGLRDKWYARLSDICKKPAR
jgi:hypothetical protein